MTTAKKSVIIGKTGVILMRDKHLLAFTFAETLLAVVIIGIIAAMTIPTLINKYHNDTLQISLKKQYRELEHNLTALQADTFYKSTLQRSILNKKYTEAETVEASAGKFITEFYTLTTDCGTTAQPCFASTYRSISGASADFECADGYSALLKGGAAICIVPASDTVDKARVVIDTNGTGAPNIGGRDMFDFYIYNNFSIDEISPADIKNNTGRNTVNAKCTSSPTGQGCLSRLIENNWEMNY